MDREIQKLLEDWARLDGMLRYAPKKAKAQIMKQKLAIGEKIIAYEKRAKK